MPIVVPAVSPIGATALSAFFPYVLPYAAGVPIPLAEQAVRSAAIDFCRNTLLVRQIITVDVVASATEYTIVPPTNTKLSRVTKVIIGNTPLKPTTFEAVYSGPALAGASVGVSTLTSGPATHFFQKDPAVANFSVYPIPDTTVVGGMVYTVAYEPTEAATTVPDILFNYWAREIGYGALVRILTTPGQGFTDPTMAAAYDKEFQSAMRSADIEARRGLTTASSSVRMRRFA